MKDRRTKRAADGGDSHRQNGSFLALGFSACGQFSRPSPRPPRTQAVETVEKVGESSAKL
jgi:hypothetical protein